MAVLDFGPPDRAPDIVFSHANGFNARTYRSILAPLADRFRILAIDMGSRGISYAQLHEHVEAVAERLRGSTRVGLLVQEDEHMAAGMLAALALGVTYVPLDPRLPPARLPMT